MQQFYPAINVASKKSFVNAWKIFFLTVMLFTTSALFAQVTDPNVRSCARKPFSNGRSQNFINTTSVAQELERRKSQMTLAQRSIASSATSGHIISPPAATQSVFPTGTLSAADPTFNRTLSMSQGGTCGISAVGTATHYKTHTFTLTAPSNVTVSLFAVDGAAITPGTADSFLGLYGPGGFVPAAACTNLIAANDDAGSALSRITTTTPLAAGTYTVVVTSFDNEPTNFPWNYTLAILYTDPSAGCTTGNKISDGSFESTAFDLTNPFWATFSTNFDSPLCDGGTCGTGGGTAGARTGSFWSWFGGAGSAAEDGSLAQSVIIPASSTTILNFYLWIGAVTTPFDATMKVKVDGVTVATYTEPPVAETGYTLRTINLSSFGDDNFHAISFEYTNSATSGNSNFSVDDVSVDVVSCSPCVAPSITGQPASVTKCTGTNTTFTTAIAGTIASYQWQVNSGSGFTNLINNAPYSGVTTATLTIAGTPVTLNGNKYRLVVTGYCGGPVTSNDAILTLNETVHTASIATPSSVCAPGATLITGTASGTATSNYTHTLTGPGTIVQNASTGTNNANASFNVTAIPAGSQIYTLTSTNTEGCIATSSVFITVNPIPVVTIAPAAPAICNGAIQQLTATVTPPVPQVANGGGAITIPLTASVAAPYPSQFAVTGLPTTGVTLKSITINGFNHTFPSDLDIVLQSPSGANVILMSDRGGSTDIVNATITFDDAAAAILPNSAIVSGTYKPTNTAGPDNFPAPGPGSITQVNPTLASLGAADYNGLWKLFIVDQFNLDGGSIASWSLTFNVPASVTYSPVTNLFADAAATVPYVAGTPVFGSVYAKPAATTTYTATATRNGCTASGTVTVTVNQLPAITVQPTPATQIACPGSNVTYSVTATGTGLAYQWRLGGVPLVNGLQASGSTVSGATSSSLTIAGVLALDAGNYDVVVSGTCPPSVTSSAVALVIASAPTITTQPGNAAICEGGNVSFTVATAGTPAPTLFQWQVSTTAVPTFTNIVGANTATLSITGVALTMNGNKYRVIVTNTCGQSVTSNGTATLTVTATTPPTITALPATICLSDAPIALVGSPVGGSFSGIGVSGFNFIPAVTAVGNYTLTYSYTNALGCTATATTIARVSDCPERARLLRDKAVIVYPIPNNGNFSFRVNSTLYNYLNLKVYNTSGGLLSTRNYSGLVYGQVVPVDLTNLPSGSYMLRFFYDDGARTSEKVIPIVIMHN